MELTQLAARLRARELSVAEAVTQAQQQAERLDELNAFISFNPEQAAVSATQAQRHLDAGSAPTLCGIPIAHKDIYMTAGIRTTCASQILQNYIAPYESHVTGLLAAVGAVSIGKCNLDEFAMGTTGENSSFGPSLNPWDKQHSPGGSSSGSAVAVAARIVPAATGTDTGGSVRMPASYCGICGIKPTYGLASRRGIIAYASSLDQAGAFATSATDLRVVLQAMIGHDDADSTSLLDANLNQPGLTQESLAGIRIGIAKEFFASGVTAGISAGVHDALAELERQGAQLIDVSIPHLDHAISAYYIIACAEASSNLARFDGLLYGTLASGSDLLETVKKSRSQGFGVEVQRRIMLGAFILSHGHIDAYYRQAQRIRRLLVCDFEDAFRECDLIATPAAPTTAPKLGSFKDDPVLMYSQDICAAPVNLAGLPALAVPCGLLNNLPFGLQLIGPARSENLMLDVAERYQTTTAHHQARPPGITANH